MRYPSRAANRFAADLPEGDDASCPPLADPRWVGWTRPLLAYLARPRAWRRLAAWSAGMGGNETVLRHMLAVLEHRGEAAATFRGASLVWRGKTRAEVADALRRPDRRQAVVGRGGG